MTDHSPFSFQSSTHSHHGVGRWFNHIWTHGLTGPTPLWLRWRWLILFLGLLSVGLETMEHLSFPTGPVFYYVEVLNIILVVLGAGFLIQTLLNVAEAKTAATRLLEQKHHLGQQLSLTRDLPELTSRLLAFAINTAHAAGGHLFVYDPNHNQLALAAQSGLVQRTGEPTRPRFDTDACLTCIAKNKGWISPLQQCRLRARTPLPPGLKGSCLPLLRGSELVGTLHLYTPEKQDGAPEKLSLLKAVSDEMASAVGLAIEKKARQEIQLAQVIDAVQLDLARDLHDTLGQNISYLRLKLDQLSELNPKAQPDIAKDIRAMSQVADESYDMMRGMLSVLKSGSSTDLLHLLTRYAEQVEDRAGIRFAFSTQGSPAVLPINVLLQLYYIFREAISNCEKYARASQVTVLIAWQNAALTLTIEDNGVGFDPAKVKKEPHYGLEFMRERMEHLGGSFTLQSRLGGGTRIILHMPYQLPTS